MPPMPLVSVTRVIERFPGRGGWHFVPVPEVAPPASAAFGMRTVRGSLDGVGFARRELMPRGDGTLFLPVSAALRRRLRKGEGDAVALVLYDDRYDGAFAEAVRESLAAEGGGVLAAFDALPPARREALLTWAYRPADAEEQVRRVLGLAGRIRRG